MANPEFRTHFAVELWAIPDIYRGATGKIRLWRDCGVRLAGRRGMPVYLNLDLSLATWLAFCMRLRGAKFLIVHSHAAQFASPKRLWIQSMFRRLLIACAYDRIAVSQAAALAMFGQSGCAKLLPALIDFDQLMVQSRSTVLPRSKSFTFGCIGRLDLQKNQAVLIYAIAKLRASGLNAKLLLVGDGEQHGALLSLAASLGVEDEVSLLAARPDIGAVYGNLLDAVLVPSVREGQCRVVAEAQFFGLPVAASGGVPDSAFLLPSAALRHVGLTVDAWFEAMVSLLDGKLQRTPPRVVLAHQSDLSFTHGVDRLLRILSV